MPLLILVPFFGFTACVLAGMWLQRRVVRRLVSRHPQVWLEVSAKAWFPQNIGYKFVNSGRHRDLHDPELTRRVMDARWVQGLAFAIWAIYAVMLLSGAGFAG